MIRKIIGSLLFVGAIILAAGAAGGYENNLCTGGEMLIMEAIACGMLFIVKLLEIE